ncbi:MAG: 50S ribosomal protein L21 [Firmicutes bacterium]|nr:50S ribosomal protein L21 [Bacillota bacterium]
MYAVVDNHGNQVRAELGKEVLVDYIEGNPGDKVIWEKILLVHSENEVPRIGKPYVQGSKVEAVLVAQEHGPKLRVFKYKPKKRERKTNGHHQPLTRVKIEKILLEG